jgi:hypothetical protein
MDIIVTLVPIALVWGLLLSVLAHDLRGPLWRRLAFIALYGLTGVALGIGIILALMRRLSFERREREAGAGRLAAKAGKS